MVKTTMGPTEGTNHVQVHGIIETKPQMVQGRDENTGRDWCYVWFKLRLPRKDGVIKCVSWWNERDGVAADLMNKGDLAKQRLVLINGKLQSKVERKGRNPFTFQSITAERLQWCDDERF